MTTKTTDQLQPGDRLLINGSLIRTVDRIVQSEFVGEGQSDRPIFVVLYAEGTTREWTAGNCGDASTEWTLAPHRHRGG